MSKFVPSIHTLESISRNAKRLRRERGIKHCDALDLVAQQIGFSNYTDAKRVISSAAGDPAMPRKRIFPLHLTAHWINEAGESGRETIRFDACREWFKELTLASLNKAFGLSAFKWDAPDHLELRQNTFDQELARRKIAVSIRALQFMELSGLRPTKGVRLDALRGTRNLPRRDHASQWMDPKTSALVLVDEPYIDPDELLEKRKQWGEFHGFECAAVGWKGMYMPGSSCMYLCAPTGTVRLDDLAKQLDAGQSPFLDSDWNGESAPFNVPFVSPDRERSTKAKRKRSMPIKPGMIRDGAIAHGIYPHEMAWRPNTTMPIEAHRTAARLVNGLIDECHGRMIDAVEALRVRGALDEWVGCEHAHSGTAMSRLSELYFPIGTRVALTRDVTSSIRELRTLVMTHYGNCAPRRALLLNLTKVQKRLIPESIAMQRGSVARAG